MRVKLAKTYTQHIHQQENVVRATDKEIAAKTAKYKHACTIAKAGCKKRFKTKAGMKIHCRACSFNYGLTERKWEVEKITTVFGRAERKVFLVKWTDRSDEDSWQKEHSLLQDECAESIKEFWNNSGINPTLDYYPDPDGAGGVESGIFRSTCVSENHGISNPLGWVLPVCMLT